MIKHFRTDHQAEFFDACARITDCELHTVAEVCRALGRDRGELLREIKANDVRALEWKGIILISLHDCMVEHEIKARDRADAAAAAIEEAIATQNQRGAARVAALEEAKARFLELRRQDAERPKTEAPG